MSNHFNGKLFFNPGLPSNRSFRDFLRWQFSADRQAWPERVANPVVQRPPATTTADELAATYVGHATFLVQTDGFNLLTDPVFSERASPFAWAGPKRVRPPAVAFDDLPPIHAVLVSHNHYDHMDVPTLRRLHERWQPQIVTGIGNGKYLAGQGLPQCVELDWYEAHVPRSGVTITYVPSQHWSRRGLFDTSQMLWGGHIVAGPAGSLYFAGDTAYPAYFSDIRERVGAPDIALLPIGAYEPRWFMGSMHMNPDDAVRAHIDLGARLSIAMHFATFHLTDEAMDAPVAALGVAREQHGVSADRFRVPAFGETIFHHKATRQGADL
jgi:L-ascorbate metabolism protein UlaG (beta-lactamase superfamily)